MTWLRPIDVWFAEQVFVFQDLHRRYARRLTGSEIEAEDLVQEAYTRLFRLEHWAQIANPHAFTMRILHNEAMERFRRADVVRIEYGGLLNALDPADDAPGPDIVAAARSELAAIARAIDALPDRCAQAVRLRRIEGLSPPEVAERMQISVSTVEKHLAKGLRLLLDQRTKLVETKPSPQDEAGHSGEWNGRRNRAQP